MPFSSTVVESLLVVVSVDRVVEVFDVVDVDLCCEVVPFAPVDVVVVPFDDSRCKIGVENSLISSSATRLVSPALVMLRIVPEIK